MYLPEMKVTQFTLMITTFYMDYNFKHSDCSNDMEKYNKILMFY